jgi:hypothetical protein
VPYSNILECLSLFGTINISLATWCQSPFIHYYFTLMPLHWINFLPSLCCTQLDSWHSTSCLVSTHIHIMPPLSFNYSLQESHITAVILQVCHGFLVNLSLWQLPESPGGGGLDFFDKWQMYRPDNVNIAAHAPLQWWCIIRCWAWRLCISTIFRYYKYSL